MNAVQPFVAGKKPRLGFIGLGWIGRNRLQALAASDCAEIAVLADTDRDVLAAAAKIAPQARRADSLAALLEESLDGVVIATPSARHADEALAALAQGRAVFCQKPLARTAAEADRVVTAARAADRLLAVDYSYRFVTGMAEVRDLLRCGELGDLYAVELTFHNAYGPDKPWFYDIAQAGGGCLMDLGTHLLDLALWCLDFPEAVVRSSQLYHHGRLLDKPVAQVEDYAIAELTVADQISLRLACSWGLPAGMDAVIDAVFYGTRGGVALRNIDGSFYDFVVERHHGTTRERLAGYPDAWGGRALETWARRLAHDPRFDPQAQHLVTVAALIDAVYGR